MSLDVMSAVWKHSEAKGAPLLTLLALADNATDEGFCFPSYPHIAAKTRMSERQVRRIISQLLDTDELSLLTRGSQGRSNEYTVNVAKLRAKTLQLGKRPGQDVKAEVDIEVATSRPPQPSAFQPSEDVVAEATPSDLGGDEQSALFESPQVTPPSAPDPLEAAVKEVWEHHAGLFQPPRPGLSDSRKRSIRAGFKEILAGRKDPTREDIEYLKRASEGLQIWRRHKPGETGVGAIFTTYPGGKPLGEQIQFFVDQAESGGTSVGPKVPSVMAGTISARKREVVDMLAYPDSPDHKQRGLAAVEWLREHVGEEPIIESGQLGGWRPVERA